MIFVGHSKGGAEAAANAVATGKKVILFNPAKANFGAYGLDADNYNGDLTSYVVDGEVLSEVLEYLPLQTVGNEEIIDEEGYWENVYNNTALGKYFKVKDSIDDHSIEQVIESLSEGKEEKWKEELKYFVKTFFPAASFFLS